MDETSTHSLSFESTEEDNVPLIEETQGCLKGICRRIPARYVLALLGFFGFFQVYAMRVNLSVALVAMVAKPDDENDTSLECQALIKNHSNSSTTKQGEFHWDAEEQSLILGSFFYGYVVTQLPGGVLAQMVGAKWLYGIGVLVTAVFTLVTPFAARWGIAAFVVVRIIEGLGEGVTYPAMNVLMGKWVPAFERTRISTIMNIGAQAGTVISMPLSGLLSDSDFLGGWPSVFYVFGLLGCVWFLFWIFLVHEEPHKHPRITKSELLFIQQNIEEKVTRDRSIPWKHIVTSVPMWALTITHFGQNWGFYTLLTELSTYLSHILHFDIKKNGTLSALPYLLQAVTALIVSMMADKLRRSGWLKITTIRKICNSIGFFGPALCLVGVTLSGCNPTLIVALFSLAMCLNGFVYSGFNVTHLDMSPEHAGTLMGITNCVANFTGFLAPAVVGWLTENEQTIHNWSIVFYISATIYIVTGLIYDIFSSAELQPWGASPSLNIDNVQNTRNINHLKNETKS